MGISRGMGSEPETRWPDMLTVQISLTSARIPAYLGLIKKVSVPGILTLRCPEPVKTCSPVNTLIPSINRSFKSFTIDCFAMSPLFFLGMNQYGLSDSPEINALLDQLRDNSFFSAW